MQECEKTDIKVEQQDSEDEGPPPGWDSKFQPEPKRQTTCSTTPTSGHFESSVNYLISALGF